MKKVEDKKCPKCNTKIDKDYYCPKCGEKTRKFHIVPYTIGMLFVFIIIAELVSQLFPLIFADGIFSEKYGVDLVYEALWALSLLVVMLLYGNAYAFKNSRMTLLQSMKLALPELVLMVSTFTINVINLIANPGVTSGFAIVNLFLFCLTIGLAEEFLCRGWLLNEFLERYGATRKQVLTSIWLSALVFGAMHLTNVLLVEQSMFMTVMQILQCIGGGFLYACIYYRSKNIWTVVSLHSLYDFSIMLGDTAYMKDCTENAFSIGVQILMIVASLLIFVAYITYGYYILRKEKMNELLPKKLNLSGKEVQKERKTAKVLLIVALVATGLAVLIDYIPVPGAEDAYTCYEYTHKDPFDDDRNYDIVYPQRLKYTVEFDTLVYTNCSPELNDSLIPEAENTEEGTRLDIQPVTNCLYPLYKPNTYEFKLDDSKEISKLYIKANEDKKELIPIKDTSVLTYVVINNEDNIIITLFGHEEGNENEIIGYAKVNKQELADSNEKAKLIADNYKTYVVPELERIGYYEFDEGDSIPFYPLATTQHVLYIDDYELYYVQ